MECAKRTFYAEVVKIKLKQVETIEKEVEIKRFKGQYI